MKKTKQKILFLYLPTGSGHYSFCKSISDQIEAYKLDNIETQILYPLNKKHKFAVFLMERFYTICSIDFPILWIIGYNLSRLKTMMRLYNKMTTKRLFNDIKEIVEKEEITKLVSSHFLYNECLAKVIEKVSHEVKGITLVTESIYYSFCLGIQTAFYLCSEFSISKTQTS